MSLSGELVPAINNKLKLAEIRPGTIAFTELKNMKDVKDGILFEYDEIKKTIKINKKELCSDLNNGILSLVPCEKGNMGIKWKLNAENGFYKFMTNDNKCLTSKKKAGDDFYKPEIVKCKQGTINQRFTYEKSNKKKHSTVNYSTGGIVKLKMLLNEVPPSTEVSVVLNNVKGKDEKIVTTAQEFNNEILQNKNIDGIDHDSIVDSTIGKTSLIEDN